MNSNPSPIRIKEIAFVGYPVTNVARARAFYEGLLGLVPAQIFGEEEGHAWIEYDIAGGTIAIASMGGGLWKPSSDGPSVALEVEDFDATIAHLRASGAKFTLEAMESPGCWLAVTQDPDGNGIAIHHRKAKA